MTDEVPEFASAFDWGIIRLATYVSPTLPKPRLLFGSVSLLTKDRPRPISSLKVESLKVAGVKDAKVYFRRVALSAENAVRWYRESSATSLSTPLPTSAEEKVAGDGMSLLPSPFDDNPEWPQLGVPLGPDLFSNAGGPGDPAPFRGFGSPRLHRRFGDNTGFDPVIQDRKAIAFLQRRVHLDLSDYSEYLGGLALIVPDPILRYVQHHLIPAKGPGNPEKAFFRAVPRPDQNVSELKLTLIERRSNLLSRFQTKDIPPDGIVTISSESQFQDTGFVISHPMHGILAYQQPTSFIRQINVQVGVQGRRVKVLAPLTDSPRSPRDDYEFAEIESNTNPIQIGSAAPNAISLVYKAEARRQKKAIAMQQRQTWFNSGQRSQATAFIRAQLARARSSVTVADPYFGATQIGQFLHAVPRTNVSFTILTSKLAFDSTFADDLESTSPENLDQPTAIKPFSRIGERLTNFSNSLKSLHTRGMINVNALVLTGSKPPLHDRFLIIDDEVLFLGNSLNALGDRASLILAVPDGDPIISNLRSMAATALSFETFASQHGVPLENGPKD